MILTRAVPDLIFSNPAGAGFAGFFMTNPAGAGAGTGFVHRTHFYHLYYQVFTVKLYFYYRNKDK